MSRADKWAGSTEPLHDYNIEQRAYDTARTIAAQPFLIVINRSGTLLPAQQVRLDPFRHPYPGGGEIDVTAESTINIVGYKDHPTIPDTDINRGDTFRIGRRNYIVTDFLPAVPGRVIAIGKVQQN